MCTLYSVFMTQKIALALIDLFHAKTRSAVQSAFLRDQATYINRRIF